MDAPTLLVLPTEFMTTVVSRHNRHLDLAKPSEKENIPSGNFDPNQVDFRYHRDIRYFFTRPSHKIQRCSGGRTRMSASMHQRTVTSVTQTEPLHDD